MTKDRLYACLTSCLIILTACNNSTQFGDTVDDPSVGHLEFLLDLKNSVAHEYWPGFEYEGLHQPVVYFTPHSTYVLNPNTHIKSITSHIPSDVFSPLSAIRLSDEYIDTTNFQFNNSYSASDTSALFYRENVLYFQSFELTRKFIPDIVDLRDWSIMVIHELFHGYQRSVPEHMAHIESVDIPGGPDAFLGTLHNELEWFKESVRLENETLKSIWRDSADLVSNLILYDSMRTARIDRVKTERNLDIRAAEDYEIMIEGHARYFESLCKRYIADHPVDSSAISLDDLKYITNMFVSYSVRNDRALYDIANDRYYYALGYNISMILERFYPEYTQTIYRSIQDLDSYVQELTRSEQH